MHEQEVCRICLSTNFLGYTCCHRNRRYTCRTDQRIYFSLSNPAHQFTKQYTCCSTECKCNKTEDDDLDRIKVQESLRTCCSTYRCTKKDNYNIHQSIGSGLCQLSYYATLFEQVTKHQHTNQRSCCRKNHADNDRNDDREQDSLQFGNRTKLIHFDLSFLLCCKKFHDRWLNDRHK